MTKTPVEIQVRTTTTGLDGLRRLLQFGWDQHGRSQALEL